MLTEKQLAARKKGIGASECAIVMEDASYCTPYKLWMIKTGRLEPEDFSDNELIQWGNRLEPIIADAYEEKTGERLQKVNKTLYHKKHNFILCHLDRKVVGKQKIVEIKTSSPFNNDWGKIGTDFVPISYIWQIQHQLAITGYEFADLAVFRSIHDFRIYEINRDEELIEIMLNKLENFWVNHVLADIAPSLTSKEDAALTYPLSRGFFKEPDIDRLAILDRFKKLRNTIRELESQKEKLVDELTLYIQDADGLALDKQILATWKANKNGIRILRITE
jgi:putative phage-type endonuclease